MSSSVICVEALWTSLIPSCTLFGVEGSAFRVWVVGFRVWGVGCRV